MPVTFRLACTAAGTLALLLLPALGHDGWLARLGLAFCAAALGMVYEEWRSPPRPDDPDESEW